MNSRAKHRNSDLATDRGVHGTLRRLRAVSGTDPGCAHASRADGHLLHRTRDLMNSHVRDALIQNFHDLIPSLSLPDPDDRHVLAAAIRGRVDVIVTYNTKDFPEEAIAPYEVSAQHPDAFLTHVLDLAPGAVLAALQRLRQSLKNPPVEPANYLSRLEQHGLSSFVAKLREFETLL